MTIYEVILEQLNLFVFLMLVIAIVYIVNIIGMWSVDMYMDRNYVKKFISRRIDGKTIWMVKVQALSWIGTEYHSHTRPLRWYEWIQLWWRGGLLENQPQSNIISKYN